MSNISKLMAEAIGAFALSFIGAGSICIATMQNAGYAGLLGVAAAHGIILSIAVSAAMNISGGHVNPAVTISMFLTKRIGLGDAIQYIVAQLAGSVVAGVFVLFMFRGMVTPDGASVVHACQLGTPNFNEEHVGSQAATLIEIAVTFLLVYSIFGTAVDPRAPRIGGWGIGMTIFADILIAGPLTGASMNPSRTFGPGLVAALSGNFDAFWSQQWVYWVGPVAGGVIAAMIYDKLILARKTA